MLSRFFVRNLEAEDLTETFIISAITSVLSIRFYLHLTNYPQIGGAHLHIAHMLWGGMLMLVALILMINFLNNFVTFICAILGGIGFGTFIDELGKFITKDNNYFFEPTVAIIYVIFVLIYLSIRLLQRYHPTRYEYLGNAFEVAREGFIQGLKKQDFEEAKLYLSKLPQNSSSVKLLNELFSKLKVIPENDRTIYIRINKIFQSFYQWFIDRRSFRTLIVLIFIIQIFYALTQSDFIVSLITHQNPQRLEFTLVGNEQSFGETGYVLSELFASIFIIIGVFYIFKSRIKAYTYFKIAILISLLISEFFDFYASQFAALPGFIANLVMLGVLNLMISREKLIAIHQQESA
jgi:hypothetical protein